MALLLLGIGLLVTRVVSLLIRPHTPNTYAHITHHTHTPINNRRPSTTRPPPAAAGAAAAGAVGVAAAAAAPTAAAATALTTPACLETRTARACSPPRLRGAVAVMTATTTACMAAGVVGVVGVAGVVVVVATGSPSPSGSAHLAAHLRGRPGSCSPLTSNPAQGGWVLCVGMLGICVMGESKRGQRDKKMCFNVCVGWPLWWCP